MCLVLFFVFCKQKTAYEIRISDWSSDVCSSDLARRKVQQAKARLQALEARAATLNRKADARRKIILGGLLLDAAMKDPAWESHLNDLMSRISRDQDRKAFESWTFK